MSRIDPFYSVNENDRNVYHYNSLCVEAGAIRREDKRSGTGRKPQCEQCIQLTHPLNGTSMESIKKS